MQFLMSTMINTASVNFYNELKKCYSIFSHGKEFHHWVKNAKKFMKLNIFFIFH